MRSTEEIPVSNIGPNGYFSLPDVSSKKIRYPLSVQNITFLTQSMRNVKQNTDIA